MLIHMSRTYTRRPERLPVIWIKDEGRDWSDVILQAFDMLLRDDPLPPVDKGIDGNRQNSHDVDN